MPHNWWTRKTLVLAAATVALACVIGFAAIGVSYPEPVASATLGPDWQCSRLAFVFTTCSRVKHYRGRACPRGQESRCARGCGRNRIRPQRTWLELEHFMQQLSRLVVAASVAALISLPRRASCWPRARRVPGPEQRRQRRPPLAATAAETAPATAEKQKPATRKKKPAKMTRQQEIDRSIDRGTVPARYRSSVPKEYQQYIPFDKR